MVSVGDSNGWGCQQVMAMGTDDSQRRWQGAEGVRRRPGWTRGAACSGGQKQSDGKRTFVNGVTFFFNGACAWVWLKKEEFYHSVWLSQLLCSLTIQFPLFCSLTPWHALSTILLQWLSLPLFLFTRSAIPIWHQEQQTAPNVHHYLPGWSLWGSVPKSSPSWNQSRLSLCFHIPKVNVMSMSWRLGGVKSRQRVCS